MGIWNGIELDGLVLHAGRLTLRPWQASDAPVVEQIMADQRIGRYLPLPRPYTAADAIEFVTEHSQHGRRTATRLDCALADNRTGELVGSASLDLPGAGPSGAIGYWIGSAHWGRGYASEASRTLARFGFGNGLHRIQIVCEPPNAASARVALRAGFRFEGIQRAALLHHGQPRDRAMFARLASDPDEPVAPIWPALAELSDGVVLVRPVQPEDWPAVLAEASNAESVGWGFSGEPMTEDEARRRCANAGLDWLIGRQAQLMICDASTGTGAGTLALRPAGPPGVAGIGYGILPEFRGRRFTTRALQLVADWAFEHTELSRLELGCKAANIASARSAEAAGFVVDARYQRRLRNPDGSYSDEIGYGRVRPLD